MLYIGWTFSPNQAPPTRFLNQWRQRDWPLHVWGTSGKEWSLCLSLETHCNNWDHPIPTNQIRLSYHRGDCQHLEYSADSRRLGRALVKEEVEEMWTDLVQLPSELVNCHIPKRNDFRSTKHKLLPKSIRNLIWKKSTAWKMYIRYKSIENFASYRKLRNDVNRLIRQTENLSRKVVIRGFKRNPKRFYGFMRRMQQTA